MPLPALTGALLGRTYAVDTLSAGTTKGPATAPLLVEVGTDVHIVGWAVDPRTSGPLARLIVQVDGLHPVPEMNCHIARPDVAAALGTSAATNSGFDAIATTTALTIGKHTIRLEAVAGDGQVFPLPTTLTIDVSKR